MMQRIIPGFEDYANFDEAIFDSEGLINNLNKKGYFWLTDFNSGNLLTRIHTEQEPYVPYRIQFPSGKILDEFEIFWENSRLKKLGFLEMEIRDAKILYHAINHEDTDKDRYNFNEHSFVSKEDEINTKKKYLENPFYLEVA